MPKFFYPPNFIFCSWSRPHGDHFGQRGIFFSFWKYPKMAKKGQNLVTAVTRDLIGRPEPNCAHIIRSLRRRENDPLLVSTYCLSDRNAISRDLISRFKPNLAHIIQCLWVLVQDCSLFSSYYLSDKVAWSRNGKLQNEIFLTVHSIPVYVYHYYVQLGLGYLW